METNKPNASDFNKNVLDAATAGRIAVLKALESMAKDNETRWLLYARSVNVMFRSLYGFCLNTAENVINKKEQEVEMAKKQAKKKNGES